jgi:hypothetical protein
MAGNRRGWDPQDNIDERNYRSGDRRGGIAGDAFQSSQTYDPTRYREREPSDWDTANERNRDWNRTYETDERRYGRGGHDHGYGAYGVSSGFLSGAEYGSSRRGTDFGSFNRGDDLVYGSGWHRGADRSVFDQDRDYLHRSNNFSGRGPRGYKRSDERIHEEVCDILEAHPHVDASEVEVEVKEGIVTLQGTVHDRQQKRFAEDAIAHLRGVVDVSNRLTIEPSH